MKAKIHGINARSNHASLLYAHCNQAYFSDSKTCDFSSLQSLFRIAMSKIKGQDMLHFTGLGPLGIRWILGLCEGIRTDERDLWCVGEREDAAVPRDLVAAERNAGFIGEAVREIQVSLTEKGRLFQLVTDGPMVAPLVQLTHWFVLKTRLRIICVRWSWKSKEKKT